MESKWKGEGRERKAEGKERGEKGRGREGMVRERKGRKGEGEGKKGKERKREGEDPLDLPLPRKNFLPAPLVHSRVGDVSDLSGPHCSITKITDFRLIRSPAAVTPSRGQWLTPVVSTAITGV